MPVEIRTVGGYGEVGKNCTALRVDDEVILLDMGLHLENYIGFTQDEDIEYISTSQLTAAEAIPDISFIKDWKKDVKAIVPTHAHLDHIGAIPFLAKKFDAPVVATPYTCAVLKKILSDEKIKLKNEIISIEPNSFYKVSDKINIEFINMTHSTPHTAMIAVHTPYGIVVYANDFKFDLTPTLGQKPSFSRLQQLGKEGVLALIVESLYSGYARKTPSEKVAKEMLKEVMLGTKNTENAIVVTTFSSHLARLKSIIEFGKKMGRKIVFLGRSLSKYVEAGQDIDLIDFSHDIKIVKWKKQIKKELKRISIEGKEKYLIVATGHQGEQRAVLNRIVEGDLGFDFAPGDMVIFSCQIIPAEVNIENRKHLEEKMRKKGVRIFSDIHTSGHASKEDLRDLINFLKPQNLIPSHGNKKMAQDFRVLAEEIGYIKGKNLHILNIQNNLLL